jgi:hypothetical protein
MYKDMNIIYNNMIMKWSEMDQFLSGVNIYSLIGQGVSFRGLREGRANIY